MNSFTATTTKIDASVNSAKLLASPKGLIVFCETKLRYESGLRAWMFLGPYLGIAIFLETVIAASHASGGRAVLYWIGFVAYLICFPSLWGQILNLIRVKKGSLAMPRASSSEDGADSNAKKSIGLL